MDYIEHTQSKMKAVIEHLKIELRGLRTGRANPAMVEHLVVEVYGTGMRMKELASISAPEPRQLLITPFDRSNAPMIAKGIEKANLGLQPVVEGHIIRISIPPMDQKLRNEMIKQAHHKQEEAKVGIRHVRREVNDTMRRKKSDGDMAEDVVKSLEKKVQDLTDRFCKEADELTAAKEKEISTI